MNRNNQASKLRTEVLVQFIREFEDGTLKDEVNLIPALLAPKDQPARSCCVFHDRAIIEQQVQTLMGYNIADIDESKSLKELQHERMELINKGEAIKEFALNVHDNACNACAKEAHIVTDQCRGCIARPCQTNCPKKAISFINGHAHINPELCINCGRCLNECAYHAITFIPIPCKAACPVGAIDKGENGKMQINKDICIACGKCTAACPFGAIMRRSNIMTVLNWMHKGETIYAAIAPSINGQFMCSKAQLQAAILKAGFTKIAEVSVGADVTTKNEATELNEKLEKGEGPMTTSCCPAYVRLAKRHIPDLAKFVSTTGSPMHYTAQMVKEKDPTAKVVFIGPCVGKIAEGEIDEFVDAVISYNELGALFVAKNIEILKVEPIEYKQIASPEAEGYGMSGGVLNAVLTYFDQNKIDCKPRAKTVNGIDKTSIRELKALAKDPSTWDFCEVMSCEGGCVGGTCTISTSKIADVRIRKQIDVQKGGDGKVVAPAKKPLTPEEKAAIIARVKASKAQK